MKLNKQILEAINRSIKLALDDFDDKIQDQEPVLFKKKILNYDAGLEALLYECYDYLDLLFDKNNTLSKDDKYILQAKIIKKINDIANKNKIYTGIKYRVLTKADLSSIIEIYRLVADFENNCNLNWIDVTNITDMTYLFRKFDINCDISEWDVSRVTNMYGMFERATKFNGDISKWDVSNVKNMSYMFYRSVFNNDISKWDVSNVKNMSYMFWRSRFNKPINDWDVHNVETMHFMFSTCNFNKPIGNWDVSNVTNMRGMFQNNKRFNQDISKWDVSTVENMDEMFENAIAFNQDLSNWTLSQKPFNMFLGCNINKEYMPKIKLFIKESRTKYKLALDDFDYNDDQLKDPIILKKKVIGKGIIESFDDVCKELTKFLDKTIIDFVNSNYDYKDEYVLKNINYIIDVYKIDNTFKYKFLLPNTPKTEYRRKLKFLCIYCLKNNILDLNWIDTEYISNMIGLFSFQDGTSVNFDISQWNVSNVTDMHNMFKDCYKFNCNLSKWDVSKVEDMFSMFENCYAFNNNISTWNTQNVKDMAWMFRNCKSFNNDISQWDVSNVTDMEGMFNLCYQFNQDLSKWNVENVANMSYMFENCPAKKYIENTWYLFKDPLTINENKHINLALDDFDDDDQEPILSKKKILNYDTYETMTVPMMIDQVCSFFNSGPYTVEQLDEMLPLIIKLNKAGKKYKKFSYKYKVKDKQELINIIQNIIYEYHTVLNEIDFNWLDISALNNLDDVFAKCGDTEITVHIEDWDTSNITSMQNVFIDSTKLKTDIGKWDVSNVETFLGMFVRCENFDCDLSNWNTSKCYNMNRMFDDCEMFTNGGNIEGLNLWDVSNVIDMSNMFRMCKQFNCNLSNWNVSSCKYMKMMFGYCESFNQDISKWDVSNVRDMSSMFNSCFRFNLDLSNWDVSNVVNMSDMFKNCHKFTSDLSYWNTASVRDISSMFEGCTIFDTDFYNWNTPHVLHMYDIFKNSGVTKEHRKYITHSPDQW